MTSRWEAETQAWVDDGLITDDQRPALLARLEQLPTPTSALASGPLMTVLMTPAAFLLIGAAVALMAAVLDPPKTAYDLLIGGASAILLVLGLVGRFLPSVKPLARGLLAAAVPTTTYTALSVLHDLDVGLLVFVGVVPPLVAWGAGWAENSRAITATSALMTIAATSYALAQASMNVLLVVVSALCLASLGATTALRLVWPTRDQVLQVGSPATVFLGTIVLVFADTPVRDLLQSVGVREAWGIEKGLLVLAFGTVALGIGLAARSGWTLVPAVLAMSMATVWLAFTVGSFIGGAIALTLVSLGLFAGAMGLWLLPWLRSAAEVPSEPA